jgi:hypothetical protein
MSEVNNSTPIIARVWFGCVVTLVFGVLAISVANAMGENVLRNFMLTSLAICFLIGGAVMGLLVTQHVTNIHLPDGMREEDDRSQLSLEERRAEQELRRANGFLGLFTISRENSSENAAHQGPRPRYRNSA